MRRWALAILLAVATSTAAAEAPPPPLDRSTPETVAAAYVAALARLDAATMRALCLRDKGLDVFLGVFVSQVTAGPQGALLSEGGMAEMSLFPVPNQSKPTVGAPQPLDDGRQVVTLTKQISLASKLVLVKQADGTWAVDLAASLKATAPEGKSGILQIVKMLEDVPAGAVAQPEEQQPWQCMNQLREVAQAIRTYAEEHGNKLPPAATWLDYILPYLDDAKALVCPDHPDEEFGYAFNRDLGGADLGGDWEQNRHRVLLVCAPGDKGNMTFSADNLAPLKGRHGDQVVYADFNGEARTLPADWTFDKIARDQDLCEKCSARMRALVEAVKQYAKGHNGLLPPADGWVEALRPLVTKPREGGSPFVCPAVVAADKVSYAYNPEIAGRKLSSLINYRKIVVFTEIEGAPGAPLASPGDVGPGRHHAEWGQVRRAGFWYRATLDGGAMAIDAGQPVAAK